MRHTGPVFVNLQLCLAEAMETEISAALWALVALEGSLAFFQVYLSQPGFNVTQV